MSSAKRIFYGVIIGSILVALIVLVISMSQLKAETKALLEHSKTLQERVTSLEKKLQITETGLSTHKYVTDALFESNWKSLARMNNNFKALGYGYLLEDKDIYPHGVYVVKE